MFNKIKFDNIDEAAFKTLKKPSFNNLMKVAIDYSDALIIGSEELPADLETYLKESNKPTLEHKSKEEFGEAYTEFFNTKVLS
jgi:starch synthase